MSGEVTVERVSLTHPDALRLIAALNAELSAAYPAENNHFSLDGEQVAPGAGTFLLAYRDGVAVGCGALRVVDDERAEIKRMYVRPAARGQRIGEHLLAELEAEARRLGRTRLVLETGSEQHAAMALYRRWGFVRGPAFGDYVETEFNLCFEKPLTGDPVEVRRATADEWSQVRELRLAALADTPDAFGSTLAREQDQPEAWWRARLDATDAATLVAWLEGRPAGLTTVAPAFDDPEAGGIYSVWVVPHARGHGVGRRLIAAALDAASDLGHTRVVLDVGDHNEAAQRLYASAGFRRTGRVGSLPPPREHVTEHELARDLAPRSASVRVSEE